MATTGIHTSTSFDHAFKKRFEQVEDSILDRLIRITKSYVVFNMSFLVLGITECILFLLCFNLLTRSSILSFTLAIMLLTIFSYCILRIYLKAQKPEQLQCLCTDYFIYIKKLLSFQNQNFDHHISIANTACRFAHQLHDLEYTFYKPPDWLTVLSPTMEKFSCWWHFKDLYLVKEVLLQQAIEEHITLIKLEPTNLQLHATLANTYVLLSEIYANPLKGDDFDEERWYPLARLSENMHYKFRQTAQRAIEEFKILNHYAPDDPWVHAQLAYSYHDLQMPKEEIAEYEIILTLRPKDEDNLYKLGLLYFEQGLNAKGLKIYEHLIHMNPEKADNLISYYGAYRPANDDYLDEEEINLNG